MRPAPEEWSDSAIAEYGDIVSQRMSNYLFAQETLNYAPIGYFSPPFGELGSPKKGYVLSADIIPQFLIGGRRIRIPVHLSPRFKVRIFRDNFAEGDSSLPVRTPSYMPGITFYIPLHRINEDTRWLRYLSVSGFHHSNGQDGPEFTTAGRINTYNGNFSTNYIEPAYHFRQRVLKPLVARICDDSEYHYIDRYGRVGLESHFKTAKDLKSSYGTQRINLTYGWIYVFSYCDKVLKHQVEESYFREKGRIVLNATAIVDRRSSGMNALHKRLNVDASGYLRIASSPNAALVGSIGYTGSDTYNIYYQDSYFYAKVGFALGFFVAPKILSR